MLCLCFFYNGEKKLQLELQESYEIPYVQQLWRGQVEWFAWSQDRQHKRGTAVKLSAGGAELLAKKDLLRTL